MTVTYVLWDNLNQRVMTFAGPHRLAKWVALPPGWGIERFLGDVSQGVVTLEDVREHARTEKP